MMLAHWVPKIAKKEETVRMLESLVAAVCRLLMMVMNWLSLISSYFLFKRPPR